MIEAVACRRRVSCSQRLSPSTGDQPFGVTAFLSHRHSRCASLVLSALNCVSTVDHLRFASTVCFVM